MQLRILVVEDEAILREVVKDYFVNEGYEVLEAADGEEALYLFQEEEIHLIILDIMLPGLDGWSICRRIRQTSNVPIIILTARSDEEDTILGFELGADDYVTKPYSPAILLARGKRLLNKQRGINTSQNKLYSHGIEVDLSSRIVKIKDNIINLTYTEFEILTYLMQNQGIVITRDRLITKIWGLEYIGDDRTINTHIRNLRHKMGDKSELIHTLVRTGYRFGGDL